MRLYPIKEVADEDLLGRPASSAKYRVSAGWICSILRVKKSEGRIDPLPRGRPVGSRKLKPHEAELQQAVADHPDATLESLGELLPVKVGVSTIFRELEALDISLKKRTSGRPSKTVPMSRPGGRRGTRDSKT